MLDTKQMCFTLIVVKHWNMLPTVVGIPENIQGHVGWVSEKHSLLKVTTLHSGWTRWHLEVTSSTNYFMI